MENTWKWPFSAALRLSKEWDGHYLAHQMEHFWNPVDIPLPDVSIE